MAAKTQLSLSATPGKRYSFTAKAESGAVETGFMSRIKNVFWIILKEEDEWL